jgi:PASTA domain
MLGVSRQSAWERWRDLDDVVEPASDDAEPTELSAAAARKSRRRSSVVVPDVVGRSWTAASEQLRGKGLVPVAVGPDGSASDQTGPEWPGSVVTDQSPESGAKVPPDSLVRLWFERGGGGAGVREPRRPKPDPLAALEERFETSDEAVG